MSNHFTGLSLGPPLGDQRLDLCDLYAFQSPADKNRTAIIRSRIVGPGRPDLELSLQCRNPEIPVPVRFTTEGEFSAVLLIVSLPLAAPTALGLNVAFSVMVCPLLNVTGQKYGEKPGAEVS